MARQRNLSDQRQLLSEATWAVLTERGLPGLTIRAVAERAGCTTGLVMHAFPSKEALLLHARDLLFERTRERADAVEAAGATPLEALRAVLRNAVSLDAAGRDEARVWLSYLAAALADPGLAERHVAGNRSFVARVERLAAAARPELPAASIRSAAVQLVALAEGLNALSAADPDTYSPDAQARALDDAVYRMLGPAPAPADPDQAADRMLGPTTPGTAAASTPAAAHPVSPSSRAGQAIRSFRPDDTESVIALWEACGLTRPWNDPRKDIARKLTVQPELFLVAEDPNGTVRGAAMAGYDGHRGWVNYLAVDPALHGHGLGRALMAQAEALLVERGCPKLNLQIREGNEPVMAFYRALGYAPDGATSFGKRLIADG